MNFQVGGEVLRTLPVISGTNQKGYPYQNQTIVVRAFDKEQHVIALELKGNRVDEYDYLKQGDKITAWFEIDSRPFTDKNGNERYSSTNEVYLIRCYKGEVSEAQMIQDQISVVAHNMSVRK